MKNNIIISVLLMFPILSFSQLKVEGMVMEANKENKHIGLPGANVYWLNTQVGTVTNEDGQFSIPYKPEYKKLIISYIGFETDTLTINKPKMVHHWLKPEKENQLDEVVVQKQRDAIQKTMFSAQNIITVNSAELLKAACCNLSESFETNPAIDVNFSDAVTGTKQIQMLGLTSPYILITQENMPLVRGASQVYGLTFTPGTWVESIQITKGAGSVVHGFESISGQINTELVKPFSDHPIFVNAYGNINGRYELNTHFNKKLTNKWSSGLYLHGSMRDQKEDNNNDNFLDAPLGKQINIMNRWQYIDTEKGWMNFINVRVMNDEKQLGEVDFDPQSDKLTTNTWGSEINTTRFDASTKLAYVFPELPYQSIAIQASFSNHNQESYYGLNIYDIKHQSVYSNLLFSSIIGSTQHKFKTGLSFTLDNYDELVNTTQYMRKENSLGAFFEYAYSNMEKLSVTAGLRIDNHNKFNVFITPRLHVRYTPWDSGSFRASVGRGKRNANIFAENQQLFASSRAINLLNSSSFDNTGGAYGLDPEIAWNFGLNFIQKFKWLDRFGDVSVDFYKTNFENQIVVDWENPREIAFYNLDGKSYANSFQIEANYEALPRLNIRTAYKYYDVKTDYNSGKLQKPLQSKHRLFGNVSYSTGKNDKGREWKFDYTYNWLGEQRLPGTSQNLPEYTLNEFSPSYSTMNAQITKVFSNKFEVYLGGENLTAFTQKKPIIASNDPFGSYFDTNIIYAPIMGDMYYVGLRLKL